MKGGGGGGEDKAMADEEGPGNGADDEPERTFPRRATLLKAYMPAPVSTQSLNLESNVETHPQLCNYLIFKRMVLFFYQ